MASRRRRYVRRGGRDQFLPRHHLRPERAEREAGHAVAHRDGGHVGTCFDNPATEFLAEQSLLLDQAHGTEHVQEIEPAGFDLGAHLVRRERTCLHRLYPQCLDRPTFVRGQHPFRFLRQDKARRAGIHPNQPGRMAATLAMRDVVLRIGKQQFIHKDGLRLRCLGVEIDHP